jgi:hypothetical protein
LLHSLKEFATGSSRARWVQSLLPPYFSECIVDFANGITERQLSGLMQHYGIWPPWCFFRRPKKLKSFGAKSWMYHGYLRHAHPNCCNRPAICQAVWVLGIKWLHGCHRWPTHVEMQEAVYSGSVCKAYNSVQHLHSLITCCNKCMKLQDDCMKCRPLFSCHMRNVILNKKLSKKQIFIMYFFLLSD